MSKKTYTELEVKEIYAQLIDQMGWFKEIALRHGADSPEVYQANILWQKDGRTFFPKV